MNADGKGSDAVTKSEEKKPRMRERGNPDSTAED
jgi:hypothetical protein